MVVADGRNPPAVLPGSRMCFPVSAARRGSTRAWGWSGGLGDGREERGGPTNIQKIHNYSIVLPWLYELRGRGSWWHLPRRKNP
ncbi:hypothetical protein FKM82_028453 [Ascaphus truei]